jgi:hypothetical protein
MSWLGYAVRKDPSMMGFQVSVWRASTRVCSGTLRRQASWFFEDQQPAARVRFSKATV